MRPGDSTAATDELPTRELRMRRACTGVHSHRYSLLDSSEGEGDDEPVRFRGEWD